MHVINKPCFTVISPRRAEFGRSGNSQGNHTGRGATNTATKYSRSHLSAAPNACDYKIGCQQARGP